MLKSKKNKMYVWFNFFLKWSMNLPELLNAKGILVKIQKRYSCSIVVYWSSTRPNMPFQRRRSCIFHLRGRAWLTIWYRVKIPRYSHRLMHRKRVTCELHDSYFRSMTIKHAIPKTAEVHEILSGRLNYYITQWRQEVSNFGVKMRKRKISPSRRSPQAPDWPVWRSESWEIRPVLVSRCSRESQHPAESWAPGPLVEQPWRTGKKRGYGHKSEEFNMLQFCSVSNSLSHTTLSIKWEVYFLKELCRSSFIVSSLWFRMHMCLYS